MIWAVIPSIAPWRGDSRRDATPYATFRGGYDAMHQAQWAVRELRKRGLRCHVDIIA